MYIFWCLYKCIFISFSSFPRRQSLLVPTSDQIADWKNTRALQKKGLRNCKTTNKQKRKIAKVEALWWAPKLSANNGEKEKKMYLALWLVLYENCPKIHDFFAP